MSGQCTLKRPIRGSGTGLHTGKKIHFTLRPAPADAGIVFVRTDLGGVSIPAHPHSVGATTLATTLVQDGVRIATIEHLMSAFAGLGIDNAYVDVDAEEIPIMDGSASIFVFLLESAGIEIQSAPKRYILIKKLIEVCEGDKKALFEPFPGSRFSLTVDFPHPLIQKSNQSISINISHTSYVKEVSRARTFGFLREIEELKAKNLVLGGSLDNALVFNEENVLNEGGLRYNDEVVRHKLLDAIGDMYLLGCRVIGSYVGYKSGHALNNQLARALLMDETAWEYTDRKYY